MEANEVFRYAKVGLCGTGRMRRMWVKVDLEGVEVMGG